MYYRMLEFRWENWMVVGVLTPCLIALYLMIMMVAYHMFCKKQHPEANAVHNNIQPTQYLEVLTSLFRNKMLALKKVPVKRFSYILCL